MYVINKYAQVCNKQVCNKQVPPSKWQVRRILPHFELTNNTTWWNGPKFLRKRHDLWPSELEPCKNDDTTCLLKSRNPRTNQS